MTFLGWAQIALFCLIIVGLTRPLGGYMTRLFAGERTFLSPVLGPVERGFYRAAGVDERTEQHWVTYGLAMLAFNALGFLLLYALQRLQGVLPLNPQGMAATSPHLSFNTAVSFVTNTNWQTYGGESTLGYLVQMAGLTVQNFVSAATGIALSVALVRGFTRAGIGHHRQFLGRSGPRHALSAAADLASSWPCSSSGRACRRTSTPTSTATTRRRRPADHRAGPGRLAGGDQDAGHQWRRLLQRQLRAPYENPTPLANFVQMLAIFAIGAGLTNLFGRMAGDERQGWAILAAMGVLFLAGVAVAYWAEAHANPALTALGVDGMGGNMEGKEVRFGIVASALFAVITTAASCGAVNAMHASFMPLGGMIPLINMELGEIIVGGVGAGLYGMLLFVIVAMFVAGLMVGRTPEYAGKKLEAKEVKMTMLAILVLPLAMLGFTALAVVIEPGLAGLLNKGPHGYSEVLYAYTSAAANNGSAFAGLTANSPFYNITLGIGMLLGRFGMIVPMLAVAGSLAAKKRLPRSLGTLPTTGTLFVGLLVGVILIVGGLTFFPALALGPIVEHLAMLGGTLF